jgi:hypothetical protein
MLFTLILLVVVGSTIWVGFDASKREWGSGSGTPRWVLGCILLWLVVFPIYLVKRTRVPLKDESRIASATVPGDPRAYRECPHCKESMRRDAEICPHCRLQSPAWRFHDGHWWFRDLEHEPWQWLDEETGQWTVHALPDGHLRGEASGESPRTMIES